MWLFCLLVCLRLLYAVSLLVGASSLRLLYALFCLLVSLRLLYVAALHVRVFFSKKHVMDSRPTLALDFSTYLQLGWVWTGSLLKQKLTQA